MDVVRPEALCQCPSPESHIGVHEHEFGYIRNFQGRREAAGRALIARRRGIPRDAGSGRKSVDSFYRYAKHVSCAALGKDIARSRRIGLELVS